jgi:predicted permease
MVWRYWLSKRTTGRRKRAEEELEEEIAAHLAIETKQRTENGETAEEAARAARRVFGNVELVKETTRSMWGSGLFERFIQDLKYALRMLRKTPGFAIAAVLTLALGIGANTAIFSIDYATLLAPLPYPDPGQLVVVWSKLHGHRETISVGDFLEWKRQNTAFQDLNAWISSSFNIAAGDRPQNIEARVVTPGLYRMLGTPFSLGRDFLPEEGQPGSNRVVILTNKFWKRLGSNPHILGSALRIDGQPYTVIGVFGPGLTDRGQGDIAVPLAFAPADINHDNHWLTVMGRLKPGVRLPQAQADMNAVTSRLARMYPNSDKGWGASVESFKNDFIPSERIMTLWLLLSAVGFVLLIACVNVANLLLARSLSRQKEMALRSALGAKPAALFLQLLIESLLLATVGGVLGTGLGYGMLQGVLAVTPPNTLPSEADFRLNLPVLLFTLAVTTLAGILFGCAPAWFAARADAAEALKEGQRSGIGVGRRRLRRLLVTGEFALALTLLAGAGLAIHSFWNLLHVDLGLRTDHTLTFYLSVPDSRTRNPERIEAYYREMLASIASSPGVSYVSAETGTPMEGPGFRTPFSVVGQSVFLDPSQRPEAGLGIVTPEFFQTFGIQLQRGRPFTEQDNRSSIRVAVVNEIFAEKYLKGANPLEQQVLTPQLDARFAPGAPVKLQIVGVIHNVRSRGLRQDIPEIYIPFWQAPWPSASIGIRTAGDPASITGSIAARVHAVDPEIALAYPRTMEQVRDDVLADDHFTAILFTTFAAIALLLATVGIYGVMAFAAAQRSHEVALRVALGATQRGVISLIMREGIALASGGVALGLIGGYFVQRAMRSTLFGIGSTDFAAVGAVGLILVIAASLACYLPARRAASSDPMQLLRID